MELLEVWSVLLQLILVKSHVRMWLVISTMIYLGRFSRYFWTTSFLTIDNMQNIYKLKYCYVFVLRHPVCHVLCCVCLCKEVVVVVSISQSNSIIFISRQERR